MYFETFTTPIGVLLIVASRTLVQQVLYDQPCRHNPNGLTQEVKKQLNEYFAGDRLTFDLPLTFSGTAFQQDAWRFLLEIPYGKTATYTQQATWIQKPQAARAVGVANSRNPLNILVPCHRVIGKNGSLTGYGGGLQRKGWLLNHEKKISSSL